MKKLLITAAALMISLVSTMAQGQVNFATRITAKNINARVQNAAGAQATGAAGYNAGLYLVSGGNATLIPGSVTSFQSPPSLFTGYVTPITVSIPGTNPGDTVTLQFRAWGGASYETATEFGSSPSFSVATGGGVNPAADLVGITGFQMVPEPSTIALGVLGAAALLFRRRK